MYVYRSVLYDCALEMILPIACKDGYDTHIGVCYSLKSAHVSVQARVRCCTSPCTKASHTLFDHGHGHGHGHGPTLFEVFIHKRHCFAYTIQDI